MQVANKLSNSFSQGLHPLSINLEKVCFAAAVLLLAGSPKSCNRLPQLAVAPALAGGQAGV